LRETGFWGEIPLEDAFALAQSNIDRALTIDPQSAEAHAVQARMYYEKYRFEEALESLNLALTFNPNLADAYKVKSNILSSLGQIKAAWESTIQALERDPFDRGSRFAAVSIVGSYRVPDHIRQLKSILAGQAEALLALDVIQAINSEASAADIYTRFGNDAGIYFLANNLKEVQGGVDQALRPIEVRLDLHFISDQLDAALRAFHSLSEERQLATINLERLSLIQMAMGQCEDGLESLNRAHGGQIRIHGQIPPNQTRSNPNLALNWIFCMRKVGRGQEAEPLLSEMRDYVATLRRNVNSGFSALEVKLHVIDGEYNEAIDTYARALDRREMSWNDRYDPVIRTLADQPQMVELNARIDEQINADRARLGWPPTQVIALDSEPGQQVANQVSARDELNVIPE